MVFFPDRNAMQFQIVQGYSPGHLAVVDEDGSRRQYFDLPFEISQTPEETEPRK